MFYSQIVLHREKDILSCECEMCVIHGLLSKIPDDLPLETLIAKAYSLYQQYSPDELAHEAILNFQRQQRYEMSRCVSLRGFHPDPTRTGMYSLRKRPKA